MHTIGQLALVHVREHAAMLGQAENVLDANAADAIKRSKMSSRLASHSGADCLGTPTRRWSRTTNSGSINAATASVSWRRERADERRDELENVGVRRALAFEEQPVELGHRAVEVVGVVE